MGSQATGESLNKPVLSGYMPLRVIGDERMLGNYDLRKPIHFEKVTPGEFTVVPYAGNLEKFKEGQEGERIKPGCSPRLLSIGMLKGGSSRYDFGSLRKRRRMG